MRQPRPSKAKRDAVVANDVPYGPVSGQSHLLEVPIRRLSDLMGPDTTLRQVYFLMALWRVDASGLSAGSIEEQMSRAVPVVQSTISRSLRILRELGLVEVFLAPHDGRIRLTRLSPIGRSFMASLRDLVPDDEEKKTDGGGEVPKKSGLSG